MKNILGAEKMKQFVGKLDRLVNSDQQTENHNKEVSQSLKTVYFTFHSC